MDIYHIWFDLKPGESDWDFAAHLGAYLGHLKAEGRIEGYRLTRCKLGFRPDGLGEFHVMIETRDMAQLEGAFQQVAGRDGPTEVLHHAVNSRVTGVRFALYRDFPDAVRHHGEERF
jgi:hypothetical protein